MSGKAKRRIPGLTILAAVIALSFLLAPVSAQAEPPKLFADDSKANKVTIQWNEIKGAQYYELWRLEKGADSWLLLEPALTDLTYADTAVQAGTTYRYTVRANNKSGPITDWSDYESITAYAIVGSLDAPDLILDKTRPGEVPMSWSETENAAGYRLMRYSRDTTGWIDIEINPTATSYTDTDVRPGNTYFYIVRAQAQEIPHGAWSDYKIDNAVTVLERGTDATPPTPTASATAPTPTRTPTVSGGGGGGSIPVSRPIPVRTVTPTSTGTPTITPTSTSTPTPAVTPTPTNTPIPTSTSTPLPKPGPVKGLTATAVTATSITISWSPPDQTPGPTEYIVQTVWTSADNRRGGPVSGDSTRGTSFSITGLQPCTAYGIRVRANSRLPNRYVNGPETSIGVTTQPKSGMSCP